MLPDAAANHYRDQQRLTVATLASVRAQWRRMGDDFDASWREVRPRVITLLAAAQLGAARAGAVYVPEVLDELGIDSDAAGEVNPRALVGVASDGRPLDTLVDGAVYTAKRAVAAGAESTEALDAGRRWLDGVVWTQVADAARVTAGVRVAASPRVAGWVRMLNPPSCGRCAVLAGKWFRANEGFQRHSRCDCRHVPASEDMAGDLRTDPEAYFRSLSGPAQDQYFTVSGAQAIRDGADIGQVVNARRGARGLTPAGARITDAEAAILRSRNGRLERTNVYGQRLYITTEGTTRRGLAGARLIESSGEVREVAGTAIRQTRNGPEVRQLTRGRARTPRLMPESIYEIAEDRQHAIDLLRRNGYIT